MGKSPVIHKIRTPAGGTGIPDMTDAARLAFTGAAHSLTPHVHSRHRLEICHMDSGKQTYRIEGVKYALAAGDLLVVFPGESHANDSQPEGKGTISWVGFKMPASKKSFLGLRGPAARYLVESLLGLRPRHFAGSPALRHHLNAMLSFSGGNRSDPAAQVRLLYHALGFVTEVLSCASHPTRRAEGAWGAEAAGFIEAHMGDTLRLADMAAHMGLSPSRFMSRFKQEIGLPPHDYVRRRRIDRAKELLLDGTGRTITDLAFELGFESSQRFSVVFRQYVGMTPQEYRGKCASGAVPAPAGGAITSAPRGARARRERR